MATNSSLLELETVRKRFEQLDVERQGLSDLIKKLKQIRDTMTTLHEETDKKKAETEKWLKDLEKKSRFVSAHATEADRQFNVAIQTFRQNADNLLKEIADSISQFKAMGEEQAKENSNQMNRIAMKLENAIEKRAAELGKQLESFRDKHIESLNQVTKTYHRMKVAYDSMETTVSTIETSLNNSSKIFNKRIDEANQSTNKLRENLFEEQRAFEEGLQKGLVARLNKIQQHIDERAKELSAGIESYIIQKEKSLKQTIQFLWIGIIASLLLGGTCAATLLTRILEK